MQHFRGWAAAISQRYANDHLSRHREVFNSIMSRFAQVVWHYNRMYECFSSGAYDLTCYHSSCLIAYYQNFPVLFSDLRFNSRIDAYCTILQQIIDYNASYIESAHKIVEDSHRAVYDSLKLPAYVTVTVEIEMRDDETDLDCSDEDWAADGQFLCYFNLLRMKPIRAVGDIYYQRMLSIANTLSANELVHTSFSIAKHLEAARGLLTELAVTDMGQPVFDINRGYVPRDSVIL